MRRDRDGQLLGASALALIGCYTGGASLSDDSSTDGREPASAGTEVATSSGLSEDSAAATSSTGVASDRQTADVDGSTTHGEAGSTSDTEATGDEPCVPTVVGDGEEFHVDAAAAPGGSGSADAPLQTIGEATALVGAGDTVLVHPGVYTGDAELVAWVEVGGTAEQPIVIRATERWAAVLDGQGNATASGIGIYGAHVTVEGFEVHGFGETGIYSYGDAATIRGNHIHDIGRWCTDDAGGLDAVVISGAGIVVEGNLIHDIGRFSPDEGGCAPATPYYMNHDHGVYVSSCTDVVIRNNVMYGITRGWGVHVYAGEGDGTTGMVIAHNTFADGNPYNPGQVILASPWVTDAAIVNNIFAYPTDTAIVTWEVSLTNVTLSNNLTVGAQMISGGGSDAVTQADNLVDVDPAFVDPDQRDYRLRAESPARDAALAPAEVAQDFDGVCRPQAAGPDIGAFEALR